MMAQVGEEVSHNLEERTEMTRASRSWLFIGTCWKLWMEQVMVAFVIQNWLTFVQLLRRKSTVLC